MFCIDEILFQVDQLIVVYVRSRQIRNMFEKLRVISIQCEIDHRQWSYAVPSIVGENKKGIDSSTCGKGVMNSQYKDEINERQPIPLPLNFIVMDMEPSAGW